VGRGEVGRLKMGLYNTILWRWGETGGVEECVVSSLPGFYCTHYDVCRGRVPAPERYAVEAMSNKIVYLGPFGNGFDHDNRSCDCGDDNKAGYG